MTTIEFSPGIGLRAFPRGMYFQSLAGIHLENPILLCEGA